MAKTIDFCGYLDSYAKQVFIKLHFVSEVSLLVQRIYIIVLTWHPTQSLSLTMHIQLTAETFRGQQTIAGPLGQQPIFGWPSGPATDLVRPEAAHSLLWPTATTS